MATRDAARIKITAPDLDYDGDGLVDVDSGAGACVYSGPTWSGFDKPETDVTCSEEAENGWGNLIRIARAGTIIDYGTITFQIDWDIADVNGGTAFGMFQSKVTGDWIITVPPNEGETAGPTITIPGTCNNMTPEGEVLTTGDGARFVANIVIKIIGELVFTAPVGGS